MTADVQRFNVRMGSKRHRAKVVNRLNYAVRSGKIVRPTRCQYCQKPTTKCHAHHQDYRMPLFVLWLCPKCHSNLHRGEYLCSRAPNAFMGCDSDEFQLAVWYWAKKEIIKRRKPNAR